MPKRILVPLDRSTVAETLAPLIADLARSSGATVRLLYVAPLPGNVTSQGKVVAYADQEMDRLDRENTDYLRAIADTHLGGVPVDCRVRFGDPGEEILREIEASGADLVAVATRTRSSVSRALLGSVAEHLVRKAPVTVMLVRSAP